MESQRFSPEGTAKRRVSSRTQAYDTFIELSALRFMGGGGGGGPFLARDGGGGGACFFPFGIETFNVEELAFLDGALPWDVAGDVDLCDRSSYDRSGLLLPLRVESSEGSLKRSAPELIRLRGRSCDHCVRMSRPSLGTRDIGLESGDSL